MSERKTAEIKFRVAPDEKARWQAAADELGMSLSEMIRSATNAHAALATEDFHPCDPRNCGPQCLQSGTCDQSCQSMPGLEPTVRTAAAPPATKPWMFGGRDV